MSIDVRPAAIFPDVGLGGRPPAGGHGVARPHKISHVGTRRLFERAGFQTAADTDSTLDGVRRVLVRLDLRAR